MNNITVRLGQWEVLQATTLLIDEEEEASIELKLDQPLVLRLRFENDPPEEGKTPKATLSVKGKGNNGDLVFTNWNNSLGTATKKPMEFAEDGEGHSIALQCAVWKIGSSRHIFLQFMKRGRK